MAQLFDDPYTFMIDETFPSGKLIRSHGGADNIFAAKAAMRAVVSQYPGRHVILRNRGRIITTQENVKLPATITHPKTAPDHPDYQINCQAALEAAFQELTESAIAKGWKRQEVITALEELARNQAIADYENSLTAAEIKRVG